MRVVDIWIFSYIKPPIVLAQEEFSKQITASSVHSSLSAHVSPFPAKPDLQWHSNEPSESIQSALAEQGVFSRHSSILMHSSESSFLKPSLQLQVNDPIIFSQ